MSRPRLAEIAGIDRSMVTLIESGDRNASEQVTLRLACALKVELPAILTDPNEAPGSTTAIVDARPPSAAGEDGTARTPLPAAGAATGGAA